MQDLTQLEELLQEDFPAKTSVLPVRGLALLVNAADYSGKLLDLWKKRKRSGSSSKTYLVCLPLTKEETLESYSARWLNSGIVFPGGCLMLNTLEYPKEGKESSSLAQILITQTPQKYYLSQKACEGILRRANRRGKTLPPALQEALEQQASVQENQ